MRMFFCNTVKPYTAGKSVCQLNAVSESVHYPAPPLGISTRSGVGGGSVWLCGEFRRRPDVSAGRPDPDQPACRRRVELRPAERGRGLVPQGFCWEQRRYEDPPARCCSPVLLIEPVITVNTGTYSHSRGRMGVCLCYTLCHVIKCPFFFKDTFYRSNLY